MFTAASFPDPPAASMRATGRRGWRRGRSAICCRREANEKAKKSNDESLLQQLDLKDRSGNNLAQFLIVPTFYQATRLSEPVRILLPTSVVMTVWRMFGSAIAPAVQPLFRIFHTMHHLLFSPQNDWNDGVRTNAGASGYQVTIDHIADADLEAFDAVVPFHLECHETIRRKQEDGRRIPALVPPREVEALCHNKLAFNRWAISHGFGRFIPPLLPVPPARDDAYPIILKATQDAWGTRSRILYDRADAAAHMPRDSSTFLQTYIPGSEEYATHLLIRSGEIIFDATIRYTGSAHPYVQGLHHPPKAKHWLASSPTLDIFASLMRALGYSDGTCCIDFRLVDGEPHIFEVNPRFGGSLVEKLGDYLAAYVPEARAAAA